MLKTEQDVIDLIAEDDRMMEMLRAAKKLDLPDWWICAGFVRAKIWDTLHHFEKRTETPDVDVIYFDPAQVDERTEKDLEEKLNRMLPGVPWSVKNEARMHMVNDIEPYESSVDAISKFPETATALGVKLDDEENVVLTAPCGLEDVLNLEVKPTPFFTGTEARAAIYEERIGKKDWKSIWPKITVHHIW
ncbi:nucleotidyltransferase family protein [Bacillus sp. H-16]|uniref:nucleotidyltransferase family protein n=1 Tax=Alteribacter salitolerans TaxID=2912333 RepID=UPI001962AF45|nr:nucleotidyltransferase family protein [Alteribacter salitolerans]MBM7095102.1 nucleotidyltransferase family protein [Alteribacter salitolerans]